MSLNDMKMGETVLTAKVVKPIPRNWPVQPFRKGQEAKNPRDKATCGYCNLSWDDGISTSITPTPSGRCPFENFHVYKRK